MNKARIKEILLAYRPGEGLEDDPDVRYALEKSQQDPELQCWLEEQRAFDGAVRAALQEIPVPDNLRERILSAAEPEVEERAGPAAAAPETSGLVRWLHPAVFASAAAIVIFLALSFTFWNPPAGESAEDPVAVAQTARELHQSLQPSFRSNQKAALVNYIEKHGATPPKTLPARFSWEESFACQIFSVRGSSVSVICFNTREHGKMHLYTFEKRAFPELRVPRQPVLGEGESDSAWASWASDEAYHVLLTGEGRENLRAALDI
ncbi:MAG: hypothetical protein GVY10_08700 [Verrucomicrobia bacterium]|jgi:hypothetical protein|nr:hypothetical protein [Verrucomicrobiota bacterium]